MNNETDAHPSASEAANVNTPAERLAQLSHDPALKAIIAANPVTPATTLVMLSQEQNFLLRRHIAGNPNAPVPLLLQLAQQFPHEFLQNPVLSLLFLTQPDFLTQLAPDAWLQLLDCPELPVAWREWLLQDGQARCQQYVGQLQTQASDSAMFLPFLITHPHLVSKHMVFLNNSQKRLLLKHSRFLNPTQLHSLARTSDLALQCAVACYPHTPVELLEQFITGDPALRKSVARNPNVPLILLQQLAEDSATPVRVAVAQHRRTPLPVLRLLASDKEPLVRAAVALHSQLDRDLFWLLADDSTVCVKAALVRNVHIPDELLGLLAYDSEKTVRENAAHNPRLPSELFSPLLEDPAEDVVKSLAGNAQLRPHLYWQLARHRTAVVRVQVARNPRAPIAVLEHLHNDEDISVRIGVARNPKTNAHMLTRLAQEKDVRIRWAVLAHKRTPQQVLLALAKQLQLPNVGPGPGIQGVVSNPHTPPEVLVQLLESSSQAFLIGIAKHPALMSNQTQIIQKYLYRLIQQETTARRYNRSYLRLCLLEEPDPSPEIQTIIARASQWEERYLVACHPRALTDLLKELANDSTPQVRVAARVALACAPHDVS